MLEGNRAGKGRHLVGARLTYADLSLFQIVAGLRYAFPKAMKRLEKRHPNVVAVHDAVAARPNIARYLDSERRIPFNHALWHLFVLAGSVLQFFAVLLYVLPNAPE